MKYGKIIIIMVISLFLMACGDELEKNEKIESNEAIQTYSCMVMVKGKRYVNTGKERDGEPHCGTPDGKIVKSVNATSTPTEDDESNFGTGYEYQIYKEDSIVVNIDDKWIVFKLEK